MKKMNFTVKMFLAVAFSCAVAYGCSEKPKDPSEGSENIQNDQGENYGAKGDDRPEPSQPGESTTGNQTTAGQDTTHH